MATGNFSYENRCVVVTNEDFEIGNIPPRDESKYKHNISYPSVGLAGYDDFNYFDMVITSGYYEGACIDFVEKDNPRDIYNMFGWNYMPQTKKELFNDIKDEFGVKEWRLKKMCANKDIDASIEIIDEYLKERERVKANKCIDGIKQRYGYEEYARTATFSNGETIYHKVG